MKFNHLFVFLLLLSSSQLYAQYSGHLDTTFGTGGLVVTSISPGENKAYCVKYLSSGKYLVAGYATFPNTGKDFAIAQYNANGTLDNSFSSDGIITIDLQGGSDDVAYCMEIQSDGKILIGGYSNNGSNKDAALIRLTSNGLLDAYLNGTGILIIDFENQQDDEIRSIEVQEPFTIFQGRMYIGGTTEFAPSKAKPVLAAYNYNGTPNMDVINTGIHMPWNPADSLKSYEVAEISFIVGEGITMIGSVENENSLHSYWIYRYHPTPDIFFGNGYTSGAWTSADIKACGMSISDQNPYLLWIGGTITDNTSGNTDFFYSNLHRNQPFSTMYDQVDVCNNNQMDVANSMDVSGNYMMCMGGYSGTPTSKKFAITKYDAWTNLIDTNFGTDGTGTLTTSFPNTQISECLGINVDQGILAVGYADNNFALAKYFDYGITFPEPPDLDNFELIFPPNHTSMLEGTIDFDWSPAPGATSYEFQWSFDPTFSVINGSYNVSGTSYSLSINVIDDFPFYIYWKVRAFDGTNWGNYSEVWDLTVMPWIPNGVSENDNENLVLYPNPSSKFVHFNLNIDAVSIYDMHGNKILQTNNPSNNTIDISSLTDGIYQAEFTINDKLLRRKIIKISSH